MPDVSRRTILASARSWLGTPYHHQASAKGIGCDCVGLVRGVWRECIGPEPVRVPRYSRDWGDANGSELMLKFFREFLREVPIATAGPGDVCCLRWRPQFVVKHCVILSENGRMIHAVNGAPVSEVVCGDWWRERFEAAFRFPGVV